MIVLYHIYSGMIILTERLSLLSGNEVHALSHGKFGKEIYQFCQRHS